MAYTAQTSLQTRAASFGAVAALHIVVITGLVGAFAAYREMVPETRFKTSEFKLPPVPPSPQPKQKAREPLDKSTMTTVEPHVAFKQDNNQLPWVDPTPPTTGTKTETVTETKVIPTPRGVFKAPAPRGRPSEWATPDDYPPFDLRLEHEGVTRFSLSISSDGRVSSCTVTGSSGFAGLDAATCALVTKRARFNPAVDEDGKATSGSYANAIRWVIPK
jgi:protein TonB